MDIQWYPGHMVKTKKEIVSNLKLVDLVIEILDARIPISSKNPDLDALLNDKQMKDQQNSGLIISKVEIFNA